MKYIDVFCSQVKHKTVGISYCFTKTQLFVIMQISFRQEGKEMIEGI